MDTASYKNMPSSTLKPPTTAEPEAAPSLKESIALKDIPGEKGWPIVGTTLAVVKDPVGFARKMRSKYGPVYYTHNFGNKVISLTGADANEFVLMDKEKIMSSEQGWAPWLKNLFPKGLMLMDFDHHRAHRQIMGVAFKTEPMKGYLARLGSEIPPHIKDWGTRGKFAFYPAIKEMALDMATNVFLGLEPGPETRKVNTALTDMVQATIAPVRVPLPFTAMRRGVQGRAYMKNWFADRTAARYTSLGDDIFTRLTQIKDENGKGFTTDEISDHMIFLWMAAHDTITSSVTRLVYELGRSPDWQEKLRTEILELGLKDRPVAFEDLAKMKLTDQAFKEALRLNPPVPMMPRRTLRETHFQGYRIPAGVIISISPYFTHRDPELWENPELFDPARFAPQEIKKRHKYAWIPYGGGAHMCLGLHFAVMQAKVIMAKLLPHYQIDPLTDYKARFQIMPLMKPVDDLPITISPIANRVRTNAHTNAHTA